MSGHSFHQTGRLVKFIFRRDRIRILVWLVALIGTTLMVAMAFENLFPTEEERMVMAETMKNPAMTAMVGPGYGIDDYTVGAMTSHEMLLFTILAVIIMNILLVVRHTRQDEERGRIEVLRSLPVGRLSTLGATMTAAVVVNGILALGTGFGLYALGIESMGLQGSLLYGIALGTSGILFAAITALFVQLSSSSRGAIGYSFAFMGLCYLLRASGDVNNETLARISPLGLILRTEVYVNNIWWPVLVIMELATIVTMMAFYLNSIRDMDQGFIPARPGRKTASRFLQGPTGLALRLLRTTVISWAVASFVLGASYGSVLGDMDAFIESNEMYQQLLAIVPGKSIVEQFISTIMLIMAIISTIPAITVLFKLKSEESRNHTEHILTRKVSRLHLMGSYLGIAMIASVVMLFLSAFGLWYAGYVTMEDPLAFSRVISSGMVYLPAMWVMVGLAACLIGFYPRVTSIVWGYLIYSFFTLYLGGLIDLPEWAAKLSPYGNIPKIPIEDMNMPKLIILTILSMLLAIVGLIGYRRRDIEG